MYVQAVCLDYPAEWRTELRQYFSRQLSLFVLSPPPHLVKLTFSVVAVVLGKAVLSSSQGAVRELLLKSLSTAECDI